MQRGEMREFLAECILEILEDGEGEQRLSNGEVADALFWALDEIVNTDARWDVIKRKVDELEGGGDEEEDDC
jgi:hypothetical protein